MTLLACRHGGLKRWRILLGVVAMLITVGLVTIPAQAGKFTQQDNKLVGLGAVGAALQGHSVALSADGNTAIVGGRTDNGFIGAAWVYVRDSNGVWVQQGTKLVGTGGVGNTAQGYSVALSADGNTAIVGGPSDNSQAGAAWVYVRGSNGVWMQQGAKLVGVGVGLGKVHQGYSVALSADGNTAIVGGYGDNSSAGAAWVFVRSGGVWTQQGSKLVGTGAVGAAQQGVSVALSADGSTAIVGGPSDNSNAGAVWVFYYSKTEEWKQFGSKLVGTGAVGSARQGRSVAFSADGRTAIVGGWGDNNHTGATWVFTRAPKGWTQHKLVGNGAVGFSSQGNAVDLSADGNTAIVGGYQDNSNVGAVWVFTRSKNGVWTQQGTKLVGTGAAGNANQGTSVALSADGNTAIVGGSSDNSNAGAAWMFGRPGVTDIDPNAGTVGGGTRVAIFGVNLFNVTGVTFSGVAATNVTPVDAETVIATTPPHAAGRVHVILSTQTSGNTRLRRGYTYEPYPTVTFLSSSANPSTVGQNVTFTAYVSGGGMAAGGQVIFKNGSQKLGTVNLTKGVAKFSTAALAAGIHRIKALFRRNGMFAPSKASLRQRVKN